MTTALVISGGGDKGAFAVGALEVLLQLGYRFDVISGTSTGALIAPLVAINDVDTLIKLYTTTKKRDIIRFNWFGFWKAWYHTKPLEKLIRTTMRGDRYDALMTSETDVLLCTVGFQSGKVYYYSQHSTVPGARPWSSFDEYVAATLASTNQPLIMPPSVLRGEQCYDGGVREIAPLGIISRIPNLDTIVVVSNFPGHPNPEDAYYDSFLKIGPRALDLMTREIIANDLAIQDLGGAKVVVIQPSGNLPSSGLEFIPETMQEMRKLGIEAAKQVLC